MSFPRNFKIIYRRNFDATTIPIDKTQHEFDCHADNVDHARRCFKEVNPDTWIIAVVPI
jgi:hypothetical protein